MVKANLLYKVCHEDLFGRCKHVSFASCLNHSFLLSGRGWNVDSDCLHGHKQAFVERNAQEHEIVIVQVFKLLSVRIDALTCPCWAKGRIEEDRGTILHRDMLKIWIGIQGGRVSTLSRTPGAAAPDDLSPPEIGSDGHAITAGWLLGAFPCILGAGNRVDTCWKTDRFCRQVFPRFSLNFWPTARLREKVSSKIWHIWIWNLTAMMAHDVHEWWPKQDTDSSFHLPVISLSVTRLLFHGHDTLLNFQTTWLK